MTLGGGKRGLKSVSHKSPQPTSNLKLKLAVAALKVESDASADDRRTAPRASLAEIKVFVREWLLEFPLKDLSHRGMGLVHLRWPLKVGERYTVDLVYEGNVVLEGVAVDVVRRDSTLAGCVLAEIDPAAAALLSHWVDRML